MSDSGDFRQHSTTVGGAFPDTRWSLIERVQVGDEAVSEQALEEICSGYWKPLYRFLRQSGSSPADAEDLTQGFLASLLRKRIFSEVAGRESGKLRSFLLACLRNYARDVHRSKTTLQRGGGSELLSIDFSEIEDFAAAEVNESVSPELAFDRQWVTTLLERVMNQLEENFLQRGSVEQFEIIKDFLAWNGAEISYAEAADRLGTTEGALKVQVHRLRAKFRDCLRAEVASTLDDPSKTEEEIRQLFSVFT